jgi:hypothetical protein
LITLPSPSIDRTSRSSIGASAALSAAAVLARAPPGSLTWWRPAPSARPDALAPGGVPCGASISLSYDGPLLLVGFLAAGGGGARVGVDVLRTARAAAALAGAGGGDGGDGAPLLRAVGAGRLPTPPGAPLPPATLFALRWTLMEAVLKARGEGLAVAGAAEVALGGARPRAGGGGCGTRTWAAALSGKEGASDAGALRRRAGEAAAEAARGAGAPLAAEVIGAFTGGGEGGGGTWEAAVYRAREGLGEEVVFAVAVAV